jgi:prepilin-type N-terminal cleavage/methylation domain-containing protein
MRRQRGYSLIEVLAALAILGIVITITMIAFMERNRRLQQASELILAYQALANEAEYLRRTDYDALETKSKFLSDTTILTPLKPFTTHVEVVVKSPGVKNVTMTIRWRQDERKASLALVRVDTGGTNLW